MEFGQKLKDARLKAGLTQETVAQSIGVSRQSLSNWENDTEYAYKANVSAAVHICRQLFPGNGFPPEVESRIVPWSMPLTE